MGRLCISQASENVLSDIVLSDKVLWGKILLDKFVYDKIIPAPISIKNLYILSIQVVIMKFAKHLIQEKET
jgi:hypothetical protein